MKTSDLFVILVFCLVLRGIAVTLMGSHGDPYYVGLAGQLGMSLALFFLCVHQFKIDRFKRREIFGQFRRSDIATGGGLAILLLLFTLGESAIFTLILAQFDLPLAYELGKFHPTAYPAHPFFSTYILSFVVANVVMPAIIEEFFFRGLMFPALALKRSYLRSAILCSALFAVLHLSKIININTFVCSFVLCCLYLHTRSLYPCIIMHGCYNLLAFLSQHYFDFHRIRAMDQIDHFGDWLPQFCMMILSLSGLCTVAYMHRGIFRRKAAGEDIKSLHGEGTQGRTITPATP